MKSVEQLAEQIVRAIFDRAEEDGAIHKDSAISVTRRVLLSHLDGAERRVTVSGHTVTMFPPATREKFPWPSAPITAAEVRTLTSEADAVIKSMIEKCAPGSLPQLDG